MPSSQRTLLPLFPLSVVMFPGSRLPLHIFEERYKLLINECIAANSAFGINLMYENKIRSIGCVARVVEVLERHADGTMEIVVEGARRYTLHGFADTRHAYSIGSISYYDDATEMVDHALVDEAASLYNKFVTIAFKGTVQSLEAFPDSSCLSFVMVQKAGLEMVQRQLFLTMTSENTRLRFLIRHFELMLPLLNDKNRIDTIIVNDGYVAIR